jgi:hypothetical protein
VSCSWGASGLTGNNKQEDKELKGRKTVERERKGKGKGKGNEGNNRNSLNTDLTRAGIFPATDIKLMGKKWVK